MKIDDDYLDKYGEENGVQGRRLLRQCVKMILQKIDEKYRGHRLSGKLIDTACGIARWQGFSTIYIMSGEVGLYEKYGFEKIGDYATIYGTTDQLFQRKI